MTKISQLSDIGAGLAAADEFVIRDVSDTSTPNKKVTSSGFVDYIISQGTVTGFTQIAAGVGPLARVLASSSGATGTLTFSTASATTLVERARIDPSGRVLVGASSTSGVAKLQVQGYVGADTGFGIFALRIGSTPGVDQAVGRIDFNDSDDLTGARIIAARDTTGTWSASSKPSRLLFSTAADGSTSPTERLRITSSGQLRLAGAGITFNGDTATANELDDYEEGTFTPVLQFGGATTGITYFLQSGRYTKIGRLVTVIIAVTLSNKGTATGAATFAGLPFTAGSIATYSCYPQVLSFADMLVFSSDASTTTINLRQVTNAGATSNLTDVNFADNTLLYLTGRYEV